MNQWSVFLRPQLPAFWVFAGVACHLTWAAYQEGLHGVALIAIYVYGSGLRYLLAMAPAFDLQASVDVVRGLSHLAFSSVAIGGFFSVVRFRGMFWCLNLFTGCLLAGMWWFVEMRGANKNPVVVSTVVAGAIIAIGCFLAGIRGAPRLPSQFRIRTLLVATSAIGLSIWGSLLLGLNYGLFVAVIAAAIAFPTGIWLAITKLSARPLEAALGFFLWRNYWWLIVVSVFNGEEHWQGVGRHFALLVDLPFTITKYFVDGSMQQKLSCSLACAIVSSSIWLLFVASGAVAFTRFAKGRAEPTKKS